MTQSLDHLVHWHSAEPAWAAQLSPSSRANWHELDHLMKDDLAHTHIDEEEQVTTETNTFEGWAILELMGHRRLAGYLSEQQVGGAAFVRLDIPDDEGQPAATQFYAPAAVYCITPTTEDMARAVAKGNRPAPVSRWELPAARPQDPEPGPGDAYIEDDEDDLVEVDPF